VASQHQREATAPRSFAYLKAARLLLLSDKKIFSSSRDDEREREIIKRANRKVECIQKCKKITQIQVHLCRNSVIHTTWKEGVMNEEKNNSRMSILPGTFDIFLILLCTFLSLFLAIGLSERE
jgi:hypothetical protein